MRLSSHHTRSSGPLDLPMTSMIDVVFLLLIFFMVTASFVKTERELDPAIQLQRKNSSGASDLEPAIVEVAWLDGTWVYRVGGQKLKTTGELTELLKKFPNQQDGAFVRVEDGAPFEMAAAAIQAGRSAGFRNVSYVPVSRK